ncbi:hypothetical protein [Spirosoma sp.]|uniref:hypothetical protein n=1 Tax=Spirosoma sp. TaxID=1899569 RepID=UPI00261FC9E4|nr:hypothetical protein [Spirosoma sp.]MCX6216588.1 hypothetical protein [Spirosoma sp.]
MSYPQTAPKPKLRGDIENATYRWVLRLENGKIFDGYSKIVGHDEKQDKEELLIDCIQRLGNNGYFKKCFIMEFYKREFMHKSQDTLLLELYSFDFKAHGEAKLRLPLMEYLSRVYERIKNGGEPDFKALKPEPIPFRAREQDDFEFTKNRFPTLDHLVTYCAEYLLWEKHYPRNRVEGWYHKVKHHYGEYPLPQASPTVRPASVDVAPAPPAAPTPPGAPPHKAAAQALKTVNMLYNKFPSNR